MRSLNIPHENFREGFIVGFQLINGIINVTVPATPTRPTVPAGTSPFLLGVKAGIEAAGCEIVGPDRQQI